MSHDGLLTALIVSVGMCLMFIFLLYYKIKQLIKLRNYSKSELDRLDKLLSEARGKISVLDEHVLLLLKEKNKALQQYHATDTLLNASNQAKYQQDITHQSEITNLRANIKTLEEKMNLAIGNYQAERRRNLIAEKTHVQDTLNQLSVLEKNLTASQQAFTKTSA